MMADSNDAFERNFKKFLTMGDSAPKRLLALRRQVLHLCLDNEETVPREFKNYLDMEPVSDKHSVLNDKCGMIRGNAQRFLETPYETSRKATVVDNVEIKEAFGRFLHREENSQLAIRIRDQYRIRNQEETVRARIICKPWRTLFNLFIQERTDANLQSGSKRSLRKMAKTDFRHFRSPTNGDRRFAECGTCATLTLLMGNAKKHSILKNWTMDIDTLIQLSVCPEASYECEWNKCQNCSYAEILEKIQATMQNFDSIKESMICFPTLLTYTSAPGKESTTYMESMDSIEEFTKELANALFTHGTGGTGAKVFKLVTLVNR